MTDEAAHTETGDAHFELYRCTECGKMSVSLGWLHGHIERHRGYTRLGIQIPFTKTSPANVPELMKCTEVIQVTDYQTVDEPEMVES